MTAALDEARADAGMFYPAHVTITVRWSEWRDNTKWLMIGHTKVIRMTRGLERDAKSQPIPGRYFYCPWRPNSTIANGYASETRAERVALRWLSIK